MSKKKDKINFKEINYNKSPFENYDITKTKPKTKSNKASRILFGTIFVGSLYDDLEYTEEDGYFDPFDDLEDF